MTRYEQATEFTLTYKGHRLQARRDGQGPALWLIHGFPTSSRDWRGLWSELAAQHEVFALDILGVGASDKPNDFDYSLAASADQWVALAETTGVPEVVVLAHDYGNAVAQELLARPREGSLGFRITSVAFLNGGLFPDATRPLRIQRLLTGSRQPCAQVGHHWVIVFTRQFNGAAKQAAPSIDVLPLDFLRQPRRHRP